LASRERKKPLIKLLDCCGEAISHPLIRDIGLGYVDLSFEHGMVQNIEKPVGDNLVALRLQVRDAHVE